MSTHPPFREFALASFVVASLCLPGRAESGRDPTGACCLADGSCVVSTSAECDAQDGIYQGDDVVCDDAACLPLGACCIPFDICEETTIQVCFGELGGLIWAPGLDCSFDCPPFGACCRPDGTCLISRQVTCELTYGGTYQGDGVDCADASCPPFCPADFDGSGDVGLSDLLAVLVAWGPYEPCPPHRPEDIDRNCDVAFSDLLVVLGGWGPCPE